MAHALGIEPIQKSLIILVMLMTLAACNTHKPTEIPVTLLDEPIAGATIEFLVESGATVTRKTYQTSPKGAITIPLPASAKVYNADIVAPEGIKKQALDLQWSWILTETSVPLTVSELEKVGIRFLRSLPIEVETGATTTTLRWNHPEGFTSTVYVSCTEPVYSGGEEFVTDELFTVRCILRVLKEETFTAEGSTTIVHKDFPLNKISVSIIQKNREGDIVSAGIKDVIIPPRE